MRAVSSRTVSAAYWWATRTSHTHQWLWTPPSTSSNVTSLAPNRTRWQYYPTEDCSDHDIITYSHIIHNHLHIILCSCVCL